MKKSDIINRLAEWRGYKTFLEVGTPTTGHQYALIDRNCFELTERLVYRVQPDSVSDGWPIDYRTESENSSELFREIRRRGRNYDVILVDPFHTYRCSRRDLTLALDVLSDQGTIVVHDCNPTARELARPKFQPGCSWCGVTYASFIDFVGTRDDLDYFTVDTDYDCGIIRRRPRINLSEQHKNAARIGLPLGWRVASLVDATRWRYFDSHRRVLLRLKSVRQFVAQEGRLFDADGITVEAESRVD